MEISIKSKKDTRSHIELSIDNDRDAIDLTVMYWDNEGEHQVGETITLDRMACEELEQALSAMRFLLKEDE